MLNYLLFTYPDDFYGISEETADGYGSTPGVADYYLTRVNYDNREHDFVARVDNFVIDIYNGIGRDFPYPLRISYTPSISLTGAQFELYKLTGYIMVDRLVGDFNAGQSYDLSYEFSESEPFYSAWSYNEQEAQFTIRFYTSGAQLYWTDYVKCGER
jgi:hypothetical protein